MNSYVARDLAGRYYVTRTFAGGGTALFASDGSLVNEIGRRGSAPGEFQLNWRVIPRGDTLYTIDRGTLRVAIADSLAQEARSFRLGVSALDLVHTDDGSSILYANTSGFPEESRTPPLVVVDADGVWVRAFGEPRDFGNDVRIAPDRANGLWITRVDEYEIDNYSVNGRLLRTIVREADWFKPHSVSIVQRVLRGVVTTLIDVQTDSAGRIWTLVQEWKFPRELFLARGANDENDQHRPLTPAELAGTIRFHVEVFEATSHLPIASAEVDDHVLRGFVEADGAGPFVYSVRETDEGELLVDVFALTLTKTNSQ